MASPTGLADTWSFLEGGRKVSDFYGYCVRCKTRKGISEAKTITLKNGRRAIRGVCPDCGSAMYRILPRT